MRPATEFMDDPISFFGQSYTQMHSIGREELETLQRRAMGIRFAQHRQSIEMLRKLADRLGITALHEFNDVVPLFFSHTEFKSYPAALIDKKRSGVRVAAKPAAKTGGNVISLMDALKRSLADET